MVYYVLTLPIRRSKVALWYNRRMTVENWLGVARIGVDLLKTLIPFGVLFLIIWLFKKEIKTLIKKGGLKLSAPGISVETLKQQTEKITTKEKKKLEILNSELETSKEREQKLHELQEYTVREKDTFFLGYHFEKTYRIIFPSQMVILNALKNFNGEIEAALANAIFRRTIWAQQFNLSHEQFIGFLVQSGLVEYRTDKIKITPLGRTFMDYLINNNVPLKIPANDMIIEEPIKS